MTSRRIFAKSLLGGVFAAGVGTCFGKMAAAQPMPPYPPGWAAPPPRRYENVPPPPGAGYVWVPGHWRWDGYRYIWIGGRYDIRRNSWHHWVDGHWIVVNGRWVWLDGHWS